MKTFILIIFMTGDHSGGTVTVPGYVTFHACETARFSAFFDSGIAANHIFPYCVPGPPYGDTDPLKVLS